jgi:ABC-type nitrate/sulfonate/bicarbonate transport system substrate-binding protein
MSRPVKLGLISEGTNTWPLYAAQALQLFERAGLQVEVTLTGSSVTQQEELIRGGFDIGFQQSDHVVRAVERGADLFVFMPHGHAPELTLVSVPQVRAIGELRGRTIAVDGARTGYALLLRRLLRQESLDDADIVFKEFGGSQERYEALKTRAATASLLNAPFDAQLLADGCTMLARMSERFPTYPGPVMAARRRWAGEHEDDLIAFIRAYDAAYTWLRDPANRTQAIAALPKRLEMKESAALAALDQFTRRARPVLSPSGLGEVIDIVWQAEGFTQPKGAPGKYMDLSYLERALQSKAA